MSKIPVLEIFGPTIQGEGNVIGKKTVFVRTAGCDYKCSWCDSKFTWDGSAKDQIRMMSPNEIANELIEKYGENFNHVTISGGNPALIKEIGTLIGILHDNDIKVGVETQGSKWQDWLTYVDDLTISPKPPSSGMQTDYLKLGQILNNLRGIGNTTLKIVVFNEVDYKYAKYIHKYFPDFQLFLQVGNDEVETEDSMQLRHDLIYHLDWLVRKVMEDKDMNDVRVLPQLHTLLWGNKRGV